MGSTSYSNISNTRPFQLVEKQNCSTSRRSHLCTLFPFLTHYILHDRHPIPSQKGWTFTWKWIFRGQADNHRSSNCYSLDSLWAIRQLLHQLHCPVRQTEDGRLATPNFYFTGVSKGTRSCVLCIFLGTKDGSFFLSELGGLSKAYSPTLQHLLSADRVTLVVLVYCTTTSNVLLFLGGGKGGFLYWDVYFPLSLCKTCNRLRSVTAPRFPSFRRMLFCLS